ncbi:MAG: tRNA (adenosine(37)-N6)-dimethylallyltransferase MiaA, partial [Gemmatimonadota bacterium]|nr:tRNA (adenosine(37)-N6)-dimethylallyltransferase MiaA [Gemmatimonadota bacterium]
GRWHAELDREMGSAAGSATGGSQRQLRALEIALLTGRPLAWWHRNAPPVEPPLRPRIYVLAPPRARLRSTIDARVGEMEAAGLVGEVRGLLAAGYGAGNPGMNATGYAELLPFLRGETSLEAALDRIRANTRAYARRQMTWFRHQLPPDAVWLDAELPLDQLAEQIAGEWRESPPDPSR